MSASVVVVVCAPSAVVVVVMIVVVVTVAGASALADIGSSSASSKMMSVSASGPKWVESAGLEWRGLSPAVVVEAEEEVAPAMVLAGTEKETWVWLLLVLGGVAVATGEEGATRVAMAAGVTRGMVGGAWISKGRMWRRKLWAGRC